MRPISVCERCRAGFSVKHVLSCKKGGLVCQCHDNTRDKAGKLAVMALMPSWVSYEAHIYYCRGVTAGIESKTTSAASSNMARHKARVDVTVHRLWEKGKI